MTWYYCFMYLYMYSSRMSDKEIAHIFKLNIKHMTGCKKFDEIMNMNNSNTQLVCIPSTNSCDFIQRFCSKLGLGENIIEICRYVCENVDKYDNFVDNLASQFRMFHLSCVYAFKYKCYQQGYIRILWYNRSNHQ